MGMSDNTPDARPDEKYTQTFMGYAPKKIPFRVSAERIRHMHGVAELMFQYADAFNCRAMDEYELYMLGLNHDIGYVRGKNGHEEAGSTLVTEIHKGIRSLMSECIRQHGRTPREYMEEHQCSTSGIPNELILLWWADLTIESDGEHAGEAVGFQKRLDRLKERCGENSRQYASARETAEWLCSYIARKLMTMP